VEEQAIRGQYIPSVSLVEIPRIVKVMCQFSTLVMPLSLGGKRADLTPTPSPIWFCPVTPAIIKMVGYLDVR
jgi:hypothetical protein